MGKKIKVEIYGAGCDKFFRTAASFRAALKKCGADGEVVEITDGKKIAARGALNLPAVFVDGRLLAQGGAVSEERARELLAGAV